MTGDPFVILLLLVVGCAAFFVGVIYLFGRLLGALGKGVVWAFRGRPAAPPPGVSPHVRICSRKSCGKTEVRRGRFCSQCGAPLREAGNDGKG